MRKFIIIITCIVLYLATSIPVGLFLYTLKTKQGIDVFHTTGFHGFVQCLYHEGQKAIHDVSTEED